MADPKRATDLRFRSLDHEVKATSAAEAEIKTKVEAVCARFPVYRD